MHKVGGLTDPHQGRTGVDVLHPAVHLLVGPEGKVQELVLDLQLYAERLEIHALNVYHIGQRTHKGRRRRLLENARFSDQQVQVLVLTGSETPTSFLKICRSAPPSTNHRLDHKKLRSPSSFTLAAPVRTMVFRPEAGRSPNPAAPLMMGKDEA